MDQKRLIEDVPPFRRPAIAGPDDPIVGQRDDGAQVYRSSTGQEYVVPPQLTAEPRSLKEGYQDLKKGFTSLVEELGEDPYGVAENIVKGIYEEGKEFYDRVSSGGASLGDVYALSGGAAAGSTAGKVPEGATRIFGGKRAENAPMSEFSRALEKLDEGEDPKKVWKETGWAIGADRKPRFEIDDSKAKVDAGSVLSAPDHKAEVNTDGLSEGPQPTYLSDILDHPTLYKQYPFLEEVEVRQVFDDDLFGYFDPDKNILALNPNTLIKTKGDFKETILHEVQHAVQEHEGFSSGSSPLTAMNALKAKGRPLYKEFNEQRRKVEDLGKRIDQDYFRQKKLAPESLLKEMRSEQSKLGKLRREVEAFEEASPSEVYGHQIGETEARDAGRRGDYSPEERSELPPKVSGLQGPLIVSEEIPKTFKGLEEWNPRATIKEGPFEYAKGGLVEDQMLAALGGLKDDGVQVDPASGNEVPPGSMDQEVSDQVDAKLSEGEYVLPADVVRFYGVDKIEKMITKAKEGLSEMEANGRIGGEKPEAPEEELPFPDEELEVSEDQPEMQMAEGGLVPDVYDQLNNRFTQPLPILWPENQQQQTAQDDSEYSPGVGGMKQTGFGKPMDEWGADDYESFASGRDTFDKITKYAGGLGGLPGLIATTAVRGVTKNIERKARERLEKQLQREDLDPKEKERYQSAYDRLAERHEEDDSLTPGKPRDSFAANQGLYGDDKIPFNEGIWDWSKKKEEKETKKDKKKEKSLVEKKKTRSSSDSSSDSSHSSSDSDAGSRNGRGITTKEDDDDDKTKLAKGGLVKRRK